MRIIIPAFVIISLFSLISVSCAEFKQAGRDIGHATRNVTRAIGHGTRRTVKAIGHGTRNTVKAVGKGSRDVYHAAKKDIEGADDD